MKQNKIALALLPAAGIVAVGLVSLRLHFQPPTVPEFALADAHEAQVLGKGDRFHLEIRPDATVEGAIAARGFLVRTEAEVPMVDTKAAPAAKASPEVRAWTPQFAIGADGVVRLDGAVEDLFAGVPPGAWEVAVAVGRPETLPTAPKDILRARDPGEAPAGRLSWRLVRQRVFLRP